MNNKHTQLPWEMQALAGDHDYAIYGPDGKDIALVRNFHKANAELLCRAVNSHDALVEALQEALTYLEANPDEYSNPKAEQVRAALAGAWEDENENV